MAWSDGLAPKAWQASSGHLPKALKFIRLGILRFEFAESTEDFLRFGFMLVFPQIAGSYRGSNFSKGGIVLANWPTSGCCSKCYAGCCPGCCLGCSGSCLPLGGVRVLCRGAVQGAPDHVCHWVVSGCCPECPGSCLPLGGVRVLSRVLFRVLGSCLPLGGVRVLSAVQGAPGIMFAIGRCLSRVRVLRIMFAIGRCQGAVQGAVQGCCSGCSGSCLPFGCVRVLSRVLRIMFAIGRCQGAVQGAVQGAPDHWAVSGCCPRCCPGVLLRGAVQGAPDHVSYWTVSGCC